MVSDDKVTFDAVVYSVSMTDGPACDTRRVVVETEDADAIKRWLDRARDWRVRVTFESVEAGDSARKEVGR